jgi:hypothetical protein
MSFVIHLLRLRERRHSKLSAQLAELIVGLDATTKGPSPLVGESKVSRSENNYFAFTRILHTNNQSFFVTSDTKMARLASAPKTTSLQNLPDNKKI